MDGKGTKRRRKIAENFNRLSRLHERYRHTDDRQTDGTAIAYSERVSSNKDVTLQAIESLSLRSLKTRHRQLP